MKLLIIGRYAWNSDDIKHNIETHPYKEDVIHFDYMQVEELCKVIGAAYALTFVSLLEGFGIPVVEAMKCNVPVIVSNTTSLPEVAGDAGLLVNPEDENDIAEKLIKIYKDENLRESLIGNCKTQSEKFDWNQSATIFYDKIMNVLNNKNSTFEK